MIKPIMKSEFFLRLPSEDAEPDDAVIGQDLLDTLHEHEHECVGLAANMIGERPCTRYRRIKVEYLDENFVHRIKNFSGYTAEIIQHEIDHCNGVVI